MSELVAVALKDDSLSVRLCIDNLSRISRASVRHLKACHEQDQSKDHSLFHNRYFLRMKP